MDKVRKWNEIWRLHEMLTDVGIEHEFSEFFGGKLGDDAGWVLIVRNPDGSRLCSAIEHVFSYGHTKDRIEIQGLLTPWERKVDDVVGWLTAENVFERIRAAVDKLTE